MNTAVKTGSQSDFQKINLDELRCVMDDSETIFSMVVSTIANQIKAVREMFMSTTTEPVIWVFPDAGV